MISGPLRSIREKRREQIPGEPAVLLPADKIGVIVRDGKPELWITMQSLIEVLDEIDRAR